MGKDVWIQVRAAGISLSSPVAIICIKRLPKAVASPGPAFTVTLATSAVSWFNKRLLEPPPTTCKVVIFRSIPVN